MTTPSAMKPTTVRLLLIKKQFHNKRKQSCFLDANGMQSRIFYITGSNITINNLVFINGNSNVGGAIYATGNITLNNVTFIANNASRGGAIAIYNGILNCAGSRFIDNCAEGGDHPYIHKMPH